MDEALTDNAMFNLKTWGACPECDKNNTFVAGHVSKVAVHAFVIELKTYYRYEYVTGEELGREFEKMAWVPYKQSKLSDADVAEELPKRYYYECDRCNKQFPEN